MEIFRAMFDLPSPYADGSLKYDYTADRVYVTENFYIPYFIYRTIITINIALVSTIIARPLPSSSAFSPPRTSWAGASCAGRHAASWKSCAPSRKS